MREAFANITKILRCIYVILICVIFIPEISQKMKKLVLEQCHYLIFCVFD